MTEPTAIRERPIIFSGPMVKAILEGRKTQTRRILLPKPKPETAAIDQRSGEETGLWYTWIKRSGKFGVHHDFNPQAWRCPYGQPGDRLWVRETFWATEGGTYYRADGDECFAACDLNQGGYPRSCQQYPNCDCPKFDAEWKPSIHMPRSACRIILEVTKVRVRHLQDIDEEEAQAEGAPLAGVNSEAGDERNYVEGFQELWDGLNRKRGFAWHTNPWVWALTFKVLEPRPAS